MVFVLIFKVAAFLCRTGRFKLTEFSSKQTGGIPELISWLMRLMIER